MTTLSPPSSPLRTRLKFCGMIRPEDAARAAALGVDAVGLIFVPGSAREVTVEQAQAVCAALPPWTALVALFQNRAVDEARAILARLPPGTWVQFHGAEDAATCQAIAGARPYIRAIPMADVTDVPAYAANFPDARLLLADAHAARGGGGQGHGFDWARLRGVAARLAQPLLLAGGLTPATAGAAVSALGPWGLDVSSGVEGPVKGVKDAGRMEAFARAVLAADAARAVTGA